MTGFDGRRSCVMLLSCIGAGPRYFLPLSDDFHTKYRLTARLFTNNTDSVINNFDALAEEIYTSDAFIHHQPDAVPFETNAREYYESCLAKVPSSVQRITVPLPLFHAFWPFHAEDPRNADPNRSRNRQGDLPTYPYGDSYILGLLKLGLPPEEVIARYLALDISTEVDLARLLARSVTALERNEREGNIKVAEFVGSTVCKQQLFHSVNHANNRLLLYMSNQILGMLECGPISDQVLDRTQELVEPQSPIHPSIGRFFGAPHVNWQTRYAVDQVRLLTFDEYLRDYVYFR
jgi:hypothetical protein